MDRKDRSAIAHSWVIGRDHMEDSHAPTLEKWTATTYRCDRPARAKMDRMILDTRLRRRSCALLTQQTTTAVVQQVSSAAVKQIPFAATRYLTCRRTRKRRPLDNQSCG